MPDAPFSEYLDALVTDGRSPDDGDDLSNFVHDLYRKEHDMTMPSLTKSAIAHDLGLVPTPARSSLAAPVTAKSPGRAGNQRRTSTLTLVLTVAAIIALLLASVWQLGFFDNDRDHSPSFLASAVPTVESSPVDQWWLEPIDSSSCPYPADSTGEAQEIVYHGPTEFPERAYGPYQRLSAADQDAYGDDARTVLACNSIASMEQIATQRAVYENYAMFHQFTPDSPRLYSDMIAHSRDISSYYQELGLSREDVMLTAVVSDEASFETNAPRYQVPLMHFAATTSDGRVVVPIANVDVVRNASQTAPEQTFYGTFAIALVDVEGELKFDETLFICLEGCSSYWPGMEVWAHTNSWLFPVDAAECSADALARLTNTPSANGDASEDIAVRSRLIDACASQDEQQQLLSPDMRVTSSSDAQPLSDDIYQAYRDAGNTPGQLQQVVQSELLTRVRTEETTFGAWEPGNVVILEDGRMAILETSVTLTSDRTTPTGRTSPVITQAYVWKVVDGIWLLDEVLPVCLGSCDAYWSDLTATPRATAVPEIEPVSIDDAVDIPAADDDSTTPTATPHYQIEPIDAAPTPTS